MQNLSLFPFITKPSTLLCAVAVQYFSNWALFRMAGEPQFLFTTSLLSTAAIRDSVTERLLGEGHLRAKVGGDRELRTTHHEELQDVRICICALYGWLATPSLCDRNISFTYFR